MTNLDEYVDNELFHGYEADFSVKLLIIKIGDGESLYRGVYKQDEYIEIKKDFYSSEYDFLEGETQQSLKRPWVEGGISVTESENGITEVSFKLVDPGVPTDDGDIEFPWLYPGICTRIKGIFSLRYMNDFGIPPREYRGFLKEMKPSFSKNSYPRAEYLFQCSGYEMTRTVRTFAYPNIGISKSAVEETITKAHTTAQPDKYKAADRSWATIPADAAEPYLTNKKIVTTILKSYDYPVEVRGSIPDIYYAIDTEVENLKKSLGTDRVLPSIKSEPITDWLLIKDILDKTGSSLIFEPHDNNGKVETTAVIENKSNSKTDIMNKELQFWFNRSDSGKRIPYNPLISKKFVMLNEPSVTISGNWQASPVIEEKDVIEDQVVKGVDGKETTKQVVTGKKVILTDIDENGDPILYELDMKLLATEQAEYTFNKLVKGQDFNFEAVKKFFIANVGAPKYPEGGSGYKVYQFHGIEASFETQGNPLAQINTVYPILGLGKYYSIGADSDLTKDIEKRKREKEKADKEEEAKALASAKRGATALPFLDDSQIKTPSGANPGTRKPKVTGLRLKSLTHNINNGSWTTSYNFGM